MSANNGGPAFPSHCRTVKDEVDGGLMYRGMTLRDYFAAKAMQSIIACKKTDFNTYELRAEFAYHQADVMLKARNA